MPQEIIRIESLHKTYTLDGVKVHALRGIDLTLN